MNTYIVELTGCTNVNVSENPLKQNKKKLIKNTNNNFL